ncbi:hypothetical protein Gpo141_00007393 [Globisporangium polare]
MDQQVHARTAEVGPLSSNWDRACELYAYIKGGTVNYGPNHAKFHNHSVTGRTFPGLYPQWGDVVNGEVQKVHLLGHSFGGNTVRMLAQLLANGTHGAPIQEVPDSHEVFQGGHENWIQSITTISRPNQGASLGSALTVIAFFDAKLDQFGIGRRATDESLVAYVKRVMVSSIFDGSTRDNCLYSLSVDGVNEENRWVQTLPGVYYYSYSVQGSFEARNLQFKKIALPQSSMLKLLQPFSLLLGGRYTMDTLGKPESWLTNDGAVNTASMVSSKLSLRGGDDAVVVVVEHIASEDVIRGREDAVQKVNSASST